MLLAVVVCPHCRRVQVVEASAARARCRVCARAFDPSSRKPFYQGEDAEEARRVASRVALSVAGAGIEAIAEATAAQERERVGGVPEVVRRLEGRAEFGVEEVGAAVEQVRFRGSAEEVLSVLERENRVYQARPGRYRWVG